MQGSGEGRGLSYFIEVVREGLSEDVTFEQRREGRESQSHVSV